MQTPPSVLFVEFVIDSIISIVNKKAHLNSYSFLSAIKEVKESIKKNNAFLFHDNIDPCENLFVFVKLMYEITIGVPEDNVYENIRKEIQRIPSALAWKAAFAQAVCENICQWEMISSIAEIIYIKTFMYDDGAENRVFNYIIEQYAKNIHHKIPEGIIKEIKELSNQIKDINIWEDAFLAACRYNKLSWAYVKAVALNNNKSKERSRPTHKSRKVHYGSVKLMSNDDTQTELAEKLAEEKLKFFNVD
ncbi:MAG: hypothetical protein NZM04_00845 [Methylacidiphilales bacterium]|nr:hypothetical protein [Candidatus Methylacidiphilales bacterium]